MVGQGSTQNLSHLVRTDDGDTKDETISKLSSI